MSRCRLPIVFDNDCLASFLWVRRTDLISSLFSKNMIVPNHVVTELKYLRNSRYSFVFLELESLIRSGSIKVESIPAKGPLAARYNKLEQGTETGKSLGRGEASAIVLAQHLNGTLASNNLADIHDYCTSEGISYICTDTILCWAFDAQLFSIKEGEQIWSEMKRRKRILPAYSFEEAVRRYRAGIPR